MRFIKKNAYLLAFIVGLSASLMSFIISNVFGFVPCEFCWYQRIAMYPLPFILGIGLLRKDKLAYIYALPISIAGGLLAFYQLLLQWGVFKQTEGCSLTAVSCAEKQLELFGFITIPLGSLIAFLTVTALLLVASRKENLPKLDTSQFKLGIIIAGLLTVAGSFILSALI